MQNLKIISAIGHNNEIGKDNGLIWRIPGDLAFFQKTTINNNVIMGRKTFESLPHLLKNRKHIVLSRDNNFNNKDIEIYSDYYQVLNKVKNSREDFYVIGGESIYRLFENDAVGDADSYFPKFSKDDWHKEIIGEGNYNDIKYKHVKYLRR